MPVLPHPLRERPALRGFVIMRGADELAAQMLNVTLGWYVYSATHNPMSLAYAGLAQFLPNLGTALLAGQAADRFDRRRIVRLSLFIQAVCLALFAAWAVARGPSAGPVYALLLAMGAARAFSAPAMSALLPSIVPDEDFPRAVATTSSVFQICGVAGPAIGGLLYAVSGPAAFAVTAGLYLTAVSQTRRLAAVSRATAGGDSGVLAGIRYVRSNRLLLSLVSLDLFAMLLGGVTALLPIYAKDILHTGPTGLGCLRCAPGVGAAIVGLLLAQRKMRRGAGNRMLECVAGFGLATAVFAVSSNFWLSLIALAAAGGFDLVSMVIRQTLVQMATPDAMRGRVSAVNWVSIGASSELGEFESGVTAAMFGAMPAALLGGLGTIAVVGLWAILFPELRGSDSIASGYYASSDDKHAAEGSAAASPDQAPGRTAGRTDECCAGLIP